MRALPLLKSLAALVAAASLAGCVTPVTRDTLAVAVPNVATIPGTVTVAAGAAGQPDSPLLKGAVEDSIARTNLFRGVLQGSGGDFELTVFLWNVRSPAAGFSMTVDVEMAWTLVRASDKAVLLKKTIKTTHTTRAGEAFAGVERVNLARSEAIRENIRQGLQSIAELKL